MPRWNKTQVRPVVTKKVEKIEKPQTVEKKLPRHPDLKPVSLSGLFDALRLNEIPFTFKLDTEIPGSPCCLITTPKMFREIDSKSHADVLAFFNEAIKANF